MRTIAGLPLWLVLTSSAAWIGVSGAIAARPWIRANRWMKATVDQNGIAAVSFSLFDLLIHLVIVFGPALLLVVAWLMTSRLRQGAAA